MNYLRFLSCSNIQIFRWRKVSAWTTFDLTALNSLYGFVFTPSCLQNLYIYVPQTLGIHSLIHFVVWGASEQRVWRDIRSVEGEIWFALSPQAAHSFGRSVEHQQCYEKCWKLFSHQKRDGSDSQDMHENGLVQCTLGAPYAVQL